MANAYRDENSIPTLIAASNVDGKTPVRLYADPVTHRLLVDSGGSATGLQYKIYATVGSTNADYLVSSYADVGAAVNAAYADLGATGGIIYLKEGNYSYSTPIVFNTAQKFVLFMGAPAGATTLTYTGGSTTIALTYNVSKAITTGHGIRDLKFVGPSSSGTTAGILIGGLGADDSKGFAGGTLRNVHVRGFGCNIVIGNNAFIVTFDNCVSNFGGKLLFAKGGAGAGATAWNVNGANTVNSGENMKFIGCTLADSANGSGSSVADFAVHVQISGITDFQFIACSFDDAQLYIDQFTGSVSTNNVHCTDCHFENPAANGITSYYFVDSITNVVGDQLYMTNCQFSQQASAGGSAPAAFIRTGSIVTLTGVTFMKNFFSSAATVTRAVLLRDGTAVNSVSWFGCTNSQTAVTYITNTIAFTVTGMANGTTGYWTATNAGLMKVSNSNTVYDPTLFPGADIGAQMNAVYAFSSDRCVHMRIPAGVFSFSTPALFNTNNKRVFIEGDPGEGTELLFTGTGVAITVNTGIQSSSPFISHSSGYGLRNFRLVGNNSTDATTQKGVLCGGTNGAAHMVIDSVDIFGFGTGLETAANTYHWLYANGTIRDNFRNVYINSASNSGEMMHFFNAFIVDPANSTPTDGFVIADYGCASLVFTGGSIDDCQVHIGLQVAACFNGVHFENPGQATWGKYTYIKVDDSSYSCITFEGCVFFNNATTNKPDEFIFSNGAHINLIGTQFFNNGGSTVATIITGGRANWFGIVNAASAVTNVIGGYAFSENGTNQGVVWGGDVQFDKTITAAGTTGARTINKTTGTVNFAAAATSLVVTNSLVTANSLIQATVGTVDTTMKTVVAVAGSGSFTLTANAAATAETRVNWQVTN